MYVNTTRLLNVDATDIQDLTRGEMEGHLQLEKLIETFRTYLPGFENCYISSIPSNIGVRETRRIKGLKCVKVEDAEGSWYYTFRYTFDKEMARRGYFTVDKGSVTVNGVSLTVCNPTEDSFQVAIIPYTHDNTNFNAIREGSVVNIEFDIIGKYMARMVALSE